MTYALIASIEGNKHNLNNQKNIVEFDRMYEDEAIVCFQHWRDNGGWLKDIPIYVMCVTHNTISSNTKDKLKELNVNYIEEYHEQVDTFSSGFLTIPYVGKVLEERLNEDVLIKIDLDMNLIQPLPKEWVNNDIPICGQYDNYCTNMQRELTPGWSNPFDTGFVISKRSSNIYHKWNSIVCELLESPESDSEWLRVRSQTGEYYLEEYAMDKLFHHNPNMIKPVQRYQIGEWYTPVSEFSDDELQNVYFWHEHLIPDPKYDKIRQKVEYFNRMRRIHNI